MSLPFPLPARYVAPMQGKGQLAPSLADIEALARAAIARMPEAFARQLEGVVLIVEDFAEDAILDDLGIDDPFALSGLYSGRSIASPAETGDLPATIHLYRRAILDEWCASSSEGGDDSLEHLVAHVLIHEAGHHMGLSDAAMHAIEEASR
jgi:predicted Zn-dependent protease with MMP-like domain